MTNSSPFLKRRSPIVSALALVVFTFITLPGVSAAQETSKRAFIGQTKDELRLFDANKAYTQSRCSLDGNWVSSEAIVSRRINRQSALELGDQIVAIAGKQLSPVSGSAVLETLATIPPDAVVDVSVVRNGSPLTLQVPCRDSLPGYALTRKAIQAAVDGEFKSCVELFNEEEAQFGGGPKEDWLRYSCAYHAGYLKNPADWAMGYYQFLQRAIERARWDPKALGNVRAVVLANRQFFEDRRQLALYQELQGQLDSAASGASSPPNRETPGSREESAVIASGTGFFVSPEGLLLTSAHVVADAKKIRVSTTSGIQAEARIIAASEATDLAILQAEFRPTRFLTLAPPRSAAVGTPVFTYGWPVANLLGSEPKFTDGTISSLSGIAGEQAYLQISVPVQPGNSGGPLALDTGQVIGVIASQAAIAPFLRQTGTLPQNINWAVKAEYAALLADLPPRQAGTTNRADAIALVRDAICYIEVSR